MESTMHPSHKTSMLRKVRKRTMTKSTTWALSAQPNSSQIPGLRHASSIPGPGWLGPDGHALSPVFVLSVLFPGISSWLCGPPPGRPSPSWDAWACGAHRKESTTSGLVQPQLWPWEGLFAVVMFWNLKLQSVIRMIFRSVSQKSPFPLTGAAIWKCLAKHVLLPFFRAFPQMEVCHSQVKEEETESPGA
jgi:hypothetical protein